MKMLEDSASCDLASVLQCPDQAERAQYVCDHGTRKAVLNPLLGGVSYSYVLAESWNSNFNHH